MCAWYYRSCCNEQTWNQPAKCTALNGSKDALKYTADCAEFYTPSLLNLHSWVNPPDASKYTLKYTFDCTRYYTPSMLDSLLAVCSANYPKYTSKYILMYTARRAVMDTPITIDGILSAGLTTCFEVSLQDAPKQIPKAFQSTPLITFWKRLRCLLLWMVPITLECTLQFYFTLRCTVSSHGALNHASEHTFKYTANCTPSLTLRLLDYMLPSKFSRCSQAHYRPALLYAHK